MTCMHLKKFKVFSSLRRPETHFRPSQGHQRAIALTGSINFFQSTTITVYEVEYQKTFNTKLGKKTIWFSAEVIKDIYHYFQEKQAGRRKRQKRKLHCFPKAYQSILQNHMAKKYKHFRRRDQNTPQTQHRIKLISSKKNNNWAILADFSPYRYEVDERSHSPTKHPKINPFVVKSLLESNCKRFRQSAIGEYFNLKRETQLKKT